jgi:hypothetical protein
VRTKRPRLLSHRRSTVAALDGTVQVVPKLRVTLAVNEMTCAVLPAAHRHLEKVEEALAYEPFVEVLGRRLL